MLPLRKDRVCETLGELHIERSQLAAIKSVHFVGIRLVLDNVVIYAEIVVNLTGHKVELPGRDRGRLFVDVGIIILVVDHDNARGIVLHAEVISDKVVPSLVQILALGDAVRLEDTADHGDELSEFRHTLVERVRRVQGGNEGAIVVSENIVVEIMAPEVDQLLIGTGVDTPGRECEAGVHFAHVLHEIDPGGVDRIDRDQLSTVEHGQNKGVVVYRELGRHPVIKGVGRHIRIGPDLQNPVDIVRHVLPPPACPSNVARLNFRRVPGPSVHGGAYCRNIPGIPGERRKTRVPRGEEPERREVAPTVRWPFPEKALKEAANVHFFTPRYT